MRLRGKDGERVHAGRMAEKEARDGLSRFRFVVLIGCEVDGRYRTVRLKKPIRSHRSPARNRIG